MINMPSYYRQSDPASIYLERTSEVASHAAELVRVHGVQPAREDSLKIAVFGIDAQIAFCTPGASLYVAGAEADNARALRFCYANLPRITTVALSLDTHRMFQIFHPAWWQDQAGHPPAPLTPITSADVVAGKWRATRHASESLEYVRKLEAAGRYVLTVWPYHALLGGLSHALVPAIHEFAMLHALARDTETVLVQKGEARLTESYSVFCPEVSAVGGQVQGAFDEALYQLLMSHDRVYVFGQAKSHCVLSTLRDLSDRIAREDPALARRVYILEDAMSPVAAPPIDPLPPELDFPSLAERGMQELALGGMRRTRTTEAL